MNLIASLIAILILTLSALGIAFSSILSPLLTVVIPYAALAVFLVGFVYRVLHWAKVARSLPHHGDLRPAELAPLDPEESAG